MATGKSDVPTAPDSAEAGVRAATSPAVMSRTETRPISESFDRARFEAALKKMDATTDESDNDEAWDTFIDLQVVRFWPIGRSAGPFSFGGLLVTLSPCGRG
jgi:hypothetical protein